MDEQIGVVIFGRKLQGRKDLSGRVALVQNRDDFFLVIHLYNMILARAEIRDAEAG